MITALTLFAWIAIGVQLVYWVCFLIAFLRKRRAVAPSSPPVSIIVCAHDEEKNLRLLVPALLAQDYPQFEVIIVEDRCNDGTYDYLLEATKQDARLKMVRVQHLPAHVNGKKFALTLGIKAASNEWVLLTDADCMPSNGWIRSMALAMDDSKQIIIGYSPYNRFAGYLNAFIRFESLVTSIQFIGWAMLGRPYMGMGRNLAYRRSLFINNKGFNNYLSVTGGDDDLFVNQHATPSTTAVVIGAESLVPSNPKKTWDEFYYQKLRHLSVGKYYKLSDKLVLGLFSSTWVLTWVLVLPVLLLGPDSTRYLWVGFAAREVLMSGVVHRASLTLGDKFEAWKTPLLDFNYAIYYLGTGLVALISKRVRWKK